MKKIHVIAVLLALLLLVGCAGAPAAKRTMVDTSNLPSLFIYNYNAFIDPTTGKTDSAAQAAWQTYMSDVYHTQISLNNSNDKSGSVGISYMFLPATIVQMANAGSILPLDDFLKNNVSWNALPDSIKSQYTYNGHIWAVPTQVSDQAIIPMINKTWLQNVNQSVPQNLTDLFNIGGAFANGDPNKNGKKDDYLFGDSGGVSLIFAEEGFNFGSSSYMMGSSLNTFFSTAGSSKIGGANLRTLSDSLYGAWVSRFGANEYGTIGYDLKSDCINDSLFGDKSKETLSLLKNMYAENAFAPKSFLITTDDSVKDNSVYFQGMFTTPSSNIGSAILAQGSDPDLIGIAPSQYKQADFDKILNEFVPVPPLSSEPQTYMNASGAYVLLKNTPMPSESINLFVDMMFASPQNYLECSVGVPENYTLQHNHTVVVKTDTTTQKLPTMPNLAPTDGIYLTSQGYSVSSAEGDTPLQTFNKAAAKIAQDYIVKYTKTEQLKPISPFVTAVNSPTYTQGQSEISKLTLQTVYSAITGTMGIDDALSAYRSTMINTFKLDVILKEANTSIKKPNTQVLQK